jgi:TPR repeat protein
MAPNALGNAYRDLGEVDKAIHYYQIAAETGNVSSQTSISCLYDQKGDFKNAAFWAKKAAENGDVLAQYNLGIYYLYGKGVPKNSQTARSYFTMAAEQGDEDAIQILENWNEG